MEDSEQRTEIVRSVILGMVACLQDLHVLLDLAEAYEVFPQAKIDQFRSNLDVSKM